MMEVVLPPGDERGKWWKVVAECAASGIAADDVLWRAGDAQADLFGIDPAVPNSGPGFAIGAGRSGTTGFRDGAAPALRDLLDAVLLHRDRERFRLAHRLLERVRRTPRLLFDLSDTDVARALEMQKAVRRDMHKMKAFVRFRAMESAGGDDLYAAWFEPEHHIVAEVAPFFMRRFATMHWVILTPDASAHWDLQDLRIGPGGQRGDVPSSDSLDHAWKSYYRNVFNPARLKVKAMTSEMPKKYWRNLPEADLIAPLIRSAAARTAEMIEARPTRPHAGHAEAHVTCSRPEDGLPGRLEDLAAAINACERCALHCHATQGVPGEGSPTAQLMIVGEQAGDQEDLAGRPFVGPAGHLLDQALRRVGISREQTFVTNAVKHFKFEPRGKRRIHKTPNASEIDACRWWLDIERSIVKPEVVVALGATAARALLGRPVRVSAGRGRVIALEGGGELVVTVHPSYLLRLQSEDDKRREWRAFLADLELARDRMVAPRAA